MLKCFILEDQAPARRLLEDYISRQDDIEVVGSTALASIARDVLTNSHIDLLFLDLHLPEADGFQFLRSLDNPPTVIVTTAYPKRALEGFETGVADYLVKPFSIERFITALDRAKLLTVKELRPLRLELQTGRSAYEYVDASEIIALSADGDYVNIKTDKCEYHVLGPLSDWFKKLPHNQFAQIHRSHIVNLERITTRGTDYIILNDHKIPIGAKFAKTLK